jgi:multiple antibiotic resistance protein
MSLFTLTLILFLIIDPIGNMESYLTLIKELDPRRQRWVIVREMLIALGFMTTFNYIGEYIFSLLHLSEPTIWLSSSVILFLIAIKILFTAPDNPRSNLVKGEPFIFPFAVPLIAGPGLLATIMLYAHIDQSQSNMLMAILIAWAVSSFLLFFSKPIKNLLKASGLMACERLIGMVLVLIAIQRFLEGIIVFWSTYPT